MTAALSTNKTSDTVDTLAEALRLLPELPHGRVAVTRHAMPYILPARHEVSGETVWLHLQTGRVDARLIDGTVLAYEAHGCCACPAAETATTADATPATRAVEGPAVQLVGTAALTRPKPGAAGDAEPDDGEDPTADLLLRFSPRFATVRSSQTPSSPVRSNPVRSRRRP